MYHNFVFQKSSPRVECGHMYKHSLQGKLFMPSPRTSTILWKNALSLQMALKYWWVGFSDARPGFLWYIPLYSAVISAFWALFSFPVSDQLCISLQNWVWVFQFVFFVCCKNMSYVTCSQSGDSYYLQKALWMLTKNPQQDTLWSMWMGFSKSHLHKAEKGSTEMLPSSMLYSAMDLSQILLWMSPTPMWKASRFLGG